MSWFTSMFSPGTSRRKSQAMSSTHDAFSLPTSSPGFTNQPYNTQVLNTPDPDSATTPYTYPPQSPIAGGAYNYVPTSNGSRSGPSSILPTHHTPLAPLPPYPPLPHTWERLRRWLSKEYPELGDTLNYGILPQDLAQVEMQFGFELPAPIRESYLIVDGQEPESSTGCAEGLFFGLFLLPLEDVLEEWRFWRDVDDDPLTGANPTLRERMQSIPPGYVRKEYSCRGWIPLITDKTGNYLGVDLNPGEAGAAGQVIVFGRDFDTKVVMWRGDGPSGWAKWFASFVEELESGEGYELGAVNDGSEDSEDDLGYESYFYDGNGRGQGDGGGEAGNAGLRLAGEYRGWSVLEAWADRSLRRWQEAGLMQDSPMVPQENEKGKRRQSLVTVAMDLASSSASAEVPIPVLADIAEESSSTAPLGNVTNKAAPRPLVPQPQPRPPVPTISVTKPPAPKPLILPTQHDIASTPSSPGSSRPSSDEDLETGHGGMMREVPHDEKPTISSRSPNTSLDDEKGGLKEAALIPLPNSPSKPSSSPESTATVIATPVPAQPLADITDLLADSAPALETEPITPVSRSPSTAPEEQPATEVKPNGNLNGVNEADNKTNELAIETKTDQQDDSVPSVKSNDEEKDKRDSSGSVKDVAI